MAYLTISLDEDYKLLEPYKSILPRSKEFDDLQEALKFCQDNHLIHACYVTQWDSPDNDAEIEYQCSMTGIEVENEAGEFYHDLSFL